MEKIKSIIAILHSFFDVLWRALVAALIALFILNPGSINTHLVTAGFTEGSIAGFIWKAGLEKTDLELKDIKVEYETLAKQLKKSQDLITQLQTPGFADGGVEGQIRTLSSENAMVLESATQVVMSVGRVLSQNEPLVSRAQAITGKGSTNWGIVFGSVPSGRDAEKKIEKAKELEYDAVLYKRRNFFRRVAKFPSRIAADAALSDVRAQLRSDAYIVNLDTWCPSSKEVSGVIECS